ncbi:hypothetical protein FACS1894191_2990 [Clostridia bacterium]|nr:hypothetical protein FACS1894191_2990 [Clostridia bacterium]
MREPTLQKRPGYKLLKQTDVISFFHMQMPRWLFCDPKYIPLSLESKVAYTFLLNRFQLSRMNGWVNSENEVFIIFPREKLAEEMGVSYRKAIECFKELLAAGLIWEQRIGRGSANHIYLAAVELSDTAAKAHDSAPFTRSAKMEHLDDGEVPVESGREALPSSQDPPESSLPNQNPPGPHAKTCENRTSECTIPEHLEVPFLYPNNIDISNKEKSNTEKVSPSGSARGAPDGQADADALADILERSELYVLPEEERGVFRNAITRLFYSGSFRVGNAVLPGPVVRSQLQCLDGSILLDTREKLRQNLDKQVKNSTAYLMAALFNNIWECKSDLMVDPYLNSMLTG